MNKTSLGFHTFTIFLKLTRKEARTLFHDFKSYAEKTGKLKIFPIGRNKIINTSDEIQNWLSLSGQHYYIADYPNQHKGILWLWRFGFISPGFIKLGEVDKSCSIKATINPKILLGEQDYLAASTVDYLPDVEALFNIEAKKISPILGEFKHYTISRPDYCVNFDLKELEIPCTSEQMITLIKRGDIPSHYSEREEPDKISKRNKTDKNSFYLESKSVTINCYRKRSQLEKKFTNCPDIESAENIIRFEVQCNYLKTYLLAKSIRYKPDISKSDIIREMLSPDFCAHIIKDYFRRVVRDGDYFTLDGAIKDVKSNHFRYPKEERLINVLKDINQFRGIHKVKAMLHGEELVTFKRTLNDLCSIGINPVTIPRDWGIPRIPNLLNTYYNCISDEQAEKANSGEHENERYFDDMLDQIEFRS